VGEGLDPDVISALDPAALSWLEAVRSSGRKGLADLVPVDMRSAYAAGRSLTQLSPPAVAEVMDILDPAAPVPLRLYRGIGADPGKAPFMVYFHGGGWVMGGFDSHDILCRAIANGARIAVVAVDYRLAPENPFPAAVEDAAEATRFLAASASRLGLDEKHWAVGGDSAGANLAVVTALGARGEAWAAGLRCQILLYPNVDATVEAPSFDCAPAGSPLTAALMRKFIGHYVADPEQRKDWRVSPLRASTLRGLPPTLLLTAGIDPLRDEGLAFARRLTDDSVRVLQAHFSDQFHGFANMGRVMPAAKVALDMVSAQLDSHLRGPTVGVTK
jgi:acetyl esterase